MEEELQLDFDLIVLGTGFVESLIAAAAARIGRKVLHLDRNAFYGGQWASFSLSTLQDWAENLKQRNNAEVGQIPPELVIEDETSLALSASGPPYFGIKYQWHVPETVANPNNGAVVPAKEENDPENELQSGLENCSLNTPEKVVWTKIELQKLNRKFNIDLAPKILFSRGALVELLISSNVARYVEFKCITRVLTWVDEKSEKSEGKLLNVPCSRSDVFTTDVISLVEKRLLMKFLDLCHSYEQKQEEWCEYAEKPFSDFLTSQSLTPKLIHFITSAIGMVDDDVICKEGLKKTSLFLNSLGRYGTMPFLFTLYGSGEIPQAFCRLCAVFEGIYILRRDVSHFVKDKDGLVTGVISEGQKFNCKNIVMDIGYCPDSFKDNCKRKQSVSRGIFHTDKSILVEEKEHVTILRMPSTSSHSAVTVIEVGSGSAVCPPNTYLVHLICYGEDAESDLKTTTQRLFTQEENDEEDKPNILFSMFFNQVIFDFKSNDNPDLAPNVCLCSGPDAALDYDESISQAKDIFGKIFPDEEFLPRAPDHTEVVFQNPDTAGDEENSTEGEELTKKDDVDSQEKTNPEDRENTSQVNPEDRENTSQVNPEDRENTSQVTE